MNNKILKKFMLALSLSAAFSLTLAGCGQPSDAPSVSTTAPQSGNIVSTGTPGSSNESQDAPSVAEPAESPSASQDADMAADADNEADIADAPDTAVSEPAASEPAASEPIAPEPDAASQTAPAAGPSLSGIDLNVRFGDDGAAFTMHLYDNSTAAKIAEYVGSADWRLPIYHYDDYENWEVMQYYDIPSRYEIPSNPQSVTHEQAGTIYYSEPNRIVLFYQDADIPSEYTPVGYIDYSQAFVDAVINNPVVEGWGNKLVHISA